WRPRWRRCWRRWWWACGTSTFICSRARSRSACSPASRAMSRTEVAIRGLEFQARHGASAAERKTHRRFQVDVTLTFDAARAIASDRLGDTIDYHAVCALVEELGTSRTFHL